MCWKLVLLPVRDNVTAGFQPQSKGHRKSNKWRPLVFLCVRVWQQRSRSYKLSVTSCSQASGWVFLDVCQYAGFFLVLPSFGPEKRWWWRSFVFVSSRLQQRLWGRCWQGSNEGPQNSTQVLQHRAKELFHHILEIRFTNPSEIASPHTVCPKKTETCIYFLRI